MTELAKPYMPEVGSRADLEQRAIRAISLMFREAGDMSWVDRAICPQVGGEAFYPDQGGGGAGAVAFAKRVCAGCPVREPCGEYGIEHERKFGIFGGYTPEEREDIRRQRKAAA